MVLMVSGFELLDYISYQQNRPVLALIVFFVLWTSALPWFAWRSNIIDKRLQAQIPSTE
jgi:hypothetical protein